MSTAGANVTEVLTQLTERLDVFGGPPADWTETSDDWFVAEFVSAVAGEGTTIADAIVRRSAARTAEELLRITVVRQAIERGDSSSRLSMDLFCVVYRFFFADVVAEFAKAVVAENVKIALPALVLIDPCDRIPEFVGSMVSELILDPCTQAHERSVNRTSATELARAIVADNVARALGLDRVMG